MKKILMLGTFLSLVANTALAEEISVIYGETFSDLLEPAIAQYEKDTGKKVNKQRIPAATIYDQKLALDLIGGKAADIMLVDSYTLPAHMEAGYLKPLTNYVQDWPEWHSIFDSFKDSVTFDGEIYALTLDTDVRMMYYNEDTFKQAGIATPWQPKNWQELMETAELLKDKGVKQPLLVPVGVARGEETTMQGFYMLLLGADETGKNRLRDPEDGKWIVDSPAIRNTLNFYKELYMDKKLSPYTSYTQGFSLPARAQAFFTGDVGIWFDGSWRNTEMFYNTGVEYSDELAAKIKYAKVPGMGCDNCLDFTNISGGWTIAVNAKVKDSEMDDVAELLHYLYKEEFFTDWIVNAAKLSTREDAVQSEGYQNDPFLSGLTDMIKSTTLRDTFPGYLIVTNGVQQMTQDIVDGKSVDKTIERYKDSLDFEFGADKIKTIQ